MINSDAAATSSSNGSPGIVDSSNAERRVWLVKTPDFLAEAINEILDGMTMSLAGDCARQECEIGMVRLYPPTADSPAKVSVILHKETVDEFKEYPKEYDLKFVKSQQKMHLFSEEGFGDAGMGGQGRATAIEGRVEQECHMKPILNEEYRTMLQQRTIEANRPKRTVQLVDSRSSSVQVGLIPHLRESDLLNRRRHRLGDLVEHRRERLPEQDVMNLIFKAFEQRSLWSLKGLSEHIQQPIVHVREILSSIANYITRGPNKNLYELKSEFQ